MKVLVLAILVSLLFVRCTMDVDARVLALQDENTVLQEKNDVVMLALDTLETNINHKVLEIISLNAEVINLNAEIQAKDNSFDSLMVILNNQLTDTVWISDTLLPRVRALLLL